MERSAGGQALRFRGYVPAVRRSEVETSGRAGGPWARLFADYPLRGLWPAGAVLSTGHPDGLLPAGRFGTSRRR